MKTGAVAKYLDSVADGTVFAICDIPNDSSSDSLKTQLSVACKRGRIVRIMRGIYCKPKYNKLLGLMIPYNPDDVAHAIARNSGWHIIPGGNSCLNLTGLSTQVPSHFMYYSDGPYKTYNVGNTDIEMRHRESKDMPDSDGLAILIHALKTKGNGNLTQDDIRTLSEYVRSHGVAMNPAEYSKTAPWIKKELQRIAHVQPL